MVTHPTESIAEVQRQKMACHQSHIQFKVETGLAQDFLHLSLYVLQNPILPPLNEMVILLIQFPITRLKGKERN